MVCHIYGSQHVRLPNMPVRLAPSSRPFEMLFVYEGRTGFIHLQPRHAPSAFILHVAGRGGPTLVQVNDPVARGRMTLWII